MDMGREIVAAGQAMEAVAEASRVLLVLSTIGRHGTDMIIGCQMRTSTPGWYSSLRAHQDIVPHGTGMGCPPNRRQPTNPGEIKGGGVKINPTGGNIGRLRREPALEEALEAWEILIFRAMPLVAIALGPEMIEDGGKTELIEARAWIGGTTTTILIMGAGEVGVLIEAEAGTEPVSGTGIYIVGNLGHSVNVEGWPL